MLVARGFLALADVADGESYNDFIKEVVVGDCLLCNVHSWLVESLPKVFLKILASSNNNENLQMALPAVSRPRNQV